MLTFILHFRQHSCGPPQAWRSSWPLTERERQFVEAALLHRGRKLRQPDFDDKAPLPEGERQSTPVARWSMR